MNGWKMNLIEGLIFLIIGIILTAYNFFNIEGVLFIHNGSQISASFNPIFIVLLMVGFFFIGAGTAQAAVTLTICKLEKNHR